MSSEINMRFPNQLIAFETWQVQSITTEYKAPLEMTTIDDPLSFLRSKSIGLCTVQTAVVQLLRGEDRGVTCRLQQ